MTQMTNTTQFSTNFSPSEVKFFLQEKQDIVESALRQYMLKASNGLENHIESMAYSLSAGGKRIRPILCMAAAESLGCDMTPLMRVPCALECIHTYSLIHDDLPAMDDDELRRGKPTNHMVYGEAGAILAGDGLLTYAFELLSSRSLAEFVPANRQLEIINIIAQAAGPLGMVGGQALDVSSENKEISFATLQLIHRCKTGALIKASVESGALLGNATDQQLTAFGVYGKEIGLAFQIVDDLLNVIGTVDQLGKAVGSDADRNKATYPALFGIEETRKKAQDAVNRAINALGIFDEKADTLRSLAEYIYYRTT